VAIPGQAILSLVAQQVATIAKETPSGHWALSAKPKQNRNSAILKAPYRSISTACKEGSA
jgi:hypothetical protein